jgi:hypothetical protein
MSKYAVRLRTPPRGVAKYTSDTPKHGVVEITVDWHDVARQMGAKAAFNKSRKTRSLNGAIVVKFIEDKEAA